MVLGETGCGKEVVVNLIQELSNRGTGPFVKLNCGAIPETLIDDEFSDMKRCLYRCQDTEERGL